MVSVAVVLCLARGEEAKRNLSCQMYPSLVVRKCLQGKEGTWTVGGGQAKAGTLHPNQQHRHLFPSEMSR